jgi:hypothetical protein
MTATQAVRTFDKIALRLFHTVVLMGLGAVALSTVVTSIQA